MESAENAKQAHAWSEPVPKTNADVKKLAKKGSDLLDRYHKQQADARSPARRPAAKSKRK